MSDRGSILISTANDIGEALVEKLGGEGYAPSVWDKEYNKLGIAEVDSAPALSVLEDSSETGTARGSILLSTANKIGAVLNKKYNTDRGFKPKEWASAASKLAPLPEKSVESSPVCAIEDGADDVPSRSLVVTIPPTLTGESQIIEKRSGRNLLSMVNYDGGVYNPDVDRVLNLTVSETQFTKNGNVYSVTTSATWKTYTVLFPIVSGVTYYEKWTLSIESGQQGSTRAYLDENFKVLAKYNNNSSDPIITNGVMTPPAGTKYLAITWTNRSTAIQTLNITEPMIEIGSTSSTWEEYNVTTYTADLGRTIHGGTADIVNGVGTGEYEILSLAVADMNNSENYPGWRNFGVRAIIGAEVSSSVTDGVSTVGQYWSYNTLGSNDILFLPRGQYNNMTQSDWINTYPDLVIQFAIKKATATAFTFDGQEIPTKNGYNAFWSDQGNTALDYYGEPEPYTRGTASGDIANVQSARTDLPFTQVKANIAPNLTGVESAEVTKAGKNLFNQNPYLATAQNTPAFSDCMFIKGGTYTFSFDKISDGVTDATSWRYCVTIYDKSGQLITDWTISPALPYRSALYSYVNGVNTTNKYISFSLQGDCYIFVRFWSGDTTADMSMLSPMLEVGSSATEYTPYEEPTVYTADLGEPVYGGYADLVSGTGKSTRIKKTVRWGDLGNVTQLADVTRKEIVLSASEEPKYTASSASTDLQNDKDLPYDQTYSGNYEHIYIANTSRIWIYLPNGTDADTEIAISYTLADALQTDLTFDGQVVRVSPGVNNLWNNAGGDTDVEYFEQE